MVLKETADESQRLQVPNKAAPQERSLRRDEETSRDGQGLVALEAVTVQSGILVSCVDGYACVMVNLDGYSGLGCHEMVAIMNGGE